ncbi:MAG: RrF2 family transcriptional regulator [Paracoccaceae bacterium]
MRLTIRTNLALRTLMFCAVNDGRIVRKHEIAQGCNASENHLAQVINALAQHGFLRTTRGRSGGMMLGRPAKTIHAGEVFRAFESNLPFAECFDNENNTCPLTNVCLLRDAIAAALDAFYGVLDRYTLADLVENNKGLSSLLSLSAAMQLASCGQNSHHSAI